MTTITLNQAELRRAAMIAFDQLYESKVKMGLKDAHGLQSTSLQTEWEGVCAEMAYYKFRGQEYTGNSGTFKKADAGSNVQIRSTTHRKGSLIIRPNDNPEHYYVLVIVQMPHFHIAGWAKGDTCLEVEFWKQPNNRPGAWFVPQSCLAPIAA